MKTNLLFWRSKTVKVTATFILTVSALRSGTVGNYIFKATRDSCQNSVVNMELGLHEFEGQTAFVWRRLCRNPSPPSLLHFSWRTPLRCVLRLCRSLFAVKTSCWSSPENTKKLLDSPWIRWRLRTPRRQNWRTGFWNVQVKDMTAVRTRRTDPDRTMRTEKRRKTMWWRIRKGSEGGEKTENGLDFSLLRAALSRSVV